MSEHKEDGYEYDVKESVEKRDPVLEELFDTLSPTNDEENNMINKPKYDSNGREYDYNMYGEQCPWQGRDWFYDDNYYIAELEGWDDLEYDDWVSDNFPDQHFIDSYNEAMEKD